MKLFIKYFNYIILFTYSLAYSNSMPNYEFETKCGDYIIKVMVNNHPNMGEREFDLYFQYKTKDSRLIYKKEVPFFHAACVQSARKNYMVLYQESYGGNVGPEDNYGIFDLNSRTMLIDPKDWPKGNEKKIQQILGYPPPRAGSDETGKLFFCCTLSANKD